MAWLGESLSSLTGHLQNLTKEVLLEPKDEQNGAGVELQVSQEKVEELEALCATQELEISALKRQNEELRRRLRDGGLSDQDEGPPATWLSVEQRGDAAFVGRRPRAPPDPAAKWQKELKEKEQLIHFLEGQLSKVEKERFEMQQGLAGLEEQVKQLKEAGSLGTQESVHRLLSENSTLKQHLKDVNRRMGELEEELQKIRVQSLDHVIDSQVCTSELRLDIEQTRKKLMNETGTQRAELLRAHQDMVNRMIQMGEKNREVEQNVWKLQVEDKNLAADMTSLIQKLGDPEQQELIYGTLKALELENQVLNLRNAQLEKAYHKVDLVAKVNEERKENEQSLQFADHNLRYSDDKKLEVHRDWLCEKQELECQLIREKEKLKEKEVALVEKEKLMESQEDSFKRNLKEVNEEVKKLGASKDELQHEKECLSRELEVMAKVVQDLEGKVSGLQEENNRLEMGLQELDKQHQDAVDQLLVLRKAEKNEKDLLKAQLEELKKIVQQKAQQTSQDVQTDVAKCNDGTSQTMSLHAENIPASSSVDQQDDELCKRLCLELSQDLCERIRNSVNFEIPHATRVTDPTVLVEAITKHYNECKWKKDTLERKVTELTKECGDSKNTIALLEEECAGLRVNVEHLAEQLVGIGKNSKETLPTIPENSEEMEIMEQKVAMLETEVEVLTEMRVNLEKDAARMCDLRQELTIKVNNLEAQLRNQENLEVEVKKLTETLSSLGKELEEAKATKIKFQDECKSLLLKQQQLQKEIHEMNVAAARNKTSNQQACEKVSVAEGSIAVLRSDIEHLQVEKSSLEEQVKALEGSHLSLSDNLKKELEYSGRAQEEVNKLTNLLEEEQNKSLLLQSKFEDASLKLQESLFLLQNKTSLEAEMVELQKDSVIQKEKILKLQNVVSDMESEKEAMIDELNQKQQLENQVQELETIKLKHVAEIESLKCTLTHKEGVVTQLLQEMEVGREMLQTLQEKLAEKDDYIHDLRKGECNLQQSEKATKSNIESHIYNLPRTQENQKENDLTLSECEQAKITGQGDTFEKQTELLESKCSRDLSGIVKTLQEECVELRIKLAELEITSKEADVWKERSQNAEKEVQLTIKKCETLEIENNRLYVSNVKFEQQLEILEGKIRMLENKCSLLKTEGAGSKGEQVSSLSAVGKEESQLENKNSDETDRGSANTSVQDLVKQLQEEKQRALGLLEERAREIDLLNTKIKHFSVIIKENELTISQLEEAKSALLKQDFHNEEKLQMTKESIAKLSEIIKEKDQELEHLEQDYSCANEQLNQQLTEAKESAMRAVSERDQLVQTVQVKHQESLQYHAEIQRLTAVLTQEMTKYQEMTARYTAKVQNMEEQKISTEASLQLQQLNMMVTARDEALQQHMMQLKMKEQELQARDLELETLRQQVESMMLQGEHSAQEKGMQEKYAVLENILTEERTKNKKLFSEMEVYQAKEATLHREVERLRVHLIDIEEAHTQETLRLEERVKELQGRLLQAEEHVKSSSTLYKSASIRANQQVETLQEQARLIAQQRDEVQERLSGAEDQVAKHSAALRNLQAVLEQFQRDKEREVIAATAVVSKQVEEAKQRHNDLLADIASLKLQLKKANEGLGAAARLGELLEKKSEAIDVLKMEVTTLQEKLNKAENEAQSVTQVVEGKIDKSLVKNVVLGYFLAPANSKEQVLQVVASVLDFNDEEKSRVQKKLGYQGTEGVSGGWFKNFLHLSEPTNDNKQSLSEAFVRFLESESIPQPKLCMLPDAERPNSSNSSNPGGGVTGSQRKSPLLLAEVQLPTFAHVGRNSSTILKDILKES